MRKILLDLSKVRNDLCTNEVTNAIYSNLPQVQKSILKGVEKGWAEKRISQTLYKTGPSGRSYQLAKNKLIEQLLYMVPFINEGDKIQKEKIKVYRFCSAIKICGLFGLASLEFALAKRTLKKAEFYHLWSEATYLCDILSTHIAVFQLDIKTAQQYHDKALLYSKYINDEIEFKWAYSRVRNYFRINGEKSDSANIKSIGDELVIKLDKNNIRCYFFYFIIRYTEYNCNSDLKGAINVLEMALEYVDNMDYDHTIIRHYFTSALVQAYISEHAYVKAESLINVFFSKSSKNTTQIFRYKELMFKIMMHRNDFEKASYLLEYLENNQKRFNDPELKDRLLIYNLFLNLINGKEVNLRKLRYRFNKINKDKDEVLLPFKIGEIAIMYLYDEDKLYDKLDALNQYTYRVLKHKRFERTVLFIRIMTKIVLGKPYDINKLQSSNNLSNGTIEIINYSCLIEFLLSKKSN